jgi:hypothetical protein
LPSRAAIEPSPTAQDYAFVTSVTEPWAAQTHIYCLPMSFTGKARQRERAVKMVLDHFDEYRSVYAAGQTIDPKVGDGWQPAAPLASSCCVAAVRNGVISQS